MDKKILIAGFVILIVVAGVMMFYEKPERSTPVHPRENAGIEHDKDLRFNASVEGNISICHLISDTEIRNQCFSIVAQELKNASLCEFIEKDYEYYDSKITDCYLRIAKAIKDPNLCEGLKIEPNKDECYLYVAFSLADMSICEEIENIASFNYCHISFAEMSKNLSICELLKEGVEEPCYTEGKSIYKLNDCKDVCYFVTIKGLGNVSLCGMVSNVTRRNKCYEYYAMTIMKNATLCEKITKNDQKYECIARITKNITQCGLIEDESKRGSCYSTIEHAVGDVSICVDIKDEIEKDYCYYTIAFDKMDKSLCKPITDKERRQACIADIGYYS